jgi:hypothetical protein
VEDPIGKAAVFHSSKKELLWEVIAGLLAPATKAARIPAGIWPQNDEN